MKKRDLVKFVMGTLGAAMILATHSGTIAQARLRVGGSQANFGTHTLSAGFTPDPTSYSVTSGGNIGVASLNLGAGCTGYATANPDVIVNYNGGRFLRFYFQPTRGRGDTALAINDPQGNWRCNDDANGLNPQVDFQNAPAGQYDIWVSSYESGANVAGRLFATELPSQTGRP